MKFFISCFLTILSIEVYSQSNTRFFTCLPLNNYTLPFNISFQGNYLILDLRNKKYELTFIDKYIDKSGYENYIYRNNLIEVITSENSTGVFTVSPHTKDQMITLGKCR